MTSTEAMACCRTRSYSVLWEIDSILERISSEDQDTDLVQHQSFKMCVCELMTYSRLLLFGGRM